MAGSVLLSALGGNAQGADPLLPETSWDGWYAGSLAGYAFGRSEIFDDDAGLDEFDGDSFSHKPSGFISGLALGHNWQASGGNLVFGGEVDVSRLMVNDTDFEGTSDDGIQTVISGMSTMRGRLGFAADNIHIYGTGGLALAHITQFAGDSDCDPGPNSSCNGWDTSDALFNTGRWDWGWTIGAGLEFRAVENWIVRGEYLYADFGKYDSVAPDDALNTGKFRNELHVARVGLIRQFGGGAAGGDGAAADWAGPYAGVIAGYGFGKATLSGDDAADGLGQFDGDSFSHTPGGAMAGLVGGHAITPINENVVLGIETDIALSDINKTDFEGASFDGIQTVISNLSTARAKVGIAGEGFHIYATGGLAAGHITQFAGDSDCDPGPDTSCNGWDHDDAVYNTGKWKLGWTVGGGAEMRIGNDWRARAEYLYVDLGKYTAKVPDEAAEFASFKNDLHIARLGLILDF